MRTDPPAGLLDAVRAYEQALGTDDLDALDRLFAPGADTLRGDAAGLLVGHDRIAAFRGTRGGAPARRLVELHVRAVDDDHALVVAVTELLRGGRGQQTQLWERTPTGWVVAAAHVHAPVPAFDTRVWRVLGDPLVPGAADGPLARCTVAVKDLFAVAGQRTGAGNPGWLADADVEQVHATAVARLLAAGADVRGVTRTDELAYSLAGTNAHSGAPPNPRAPGRVPGGSSSGSAAAVALGQADLGLGTDTGGSIRVPASYQGLYGIRTTHGAVPTTGLVPLAPSFDTVGWLARDAELLAAVGDVLLPATPGTRGGSGWSGRLLVSDALLAYAHDDVAASVSGFADAAGAARTGRWDDVDLGAWAEVFRVLQAWEAWRVHGAWVRAHPDALGPDVASRFAAASSVGDEAGAAARAERGTIRDRVVDLVGDDVLVLPATPSVAPRPDPAELDAVRAATLRLTCLAGLGGLPAVVLPARPAPPPGDLPLVGRSSPPPVGVCLVAAPGRDHDLLALARDLAGTC